MTVYINGVKASKTDITELAERVRRGVDCVLDWHFTKTNNIAITTI